MNSEYKKLLINGANYSRYMRLPFTFQKTLNEQLDSAVVDLFSTTRKEPFKPFDKATLGYDSYIVAEDIVTEIVGRNLYNHSITLLEETKEAERIICGAKSFTMPLVPDYADGASIASYEWLHQTQGGNESNYKEYRFELLGDESGLFASGTYTSPVTDEEYITSFALNDCFNWMLDASGSPIPSEKSTPIRWKCWRTEKGSALSLISKSQVGNKNIYDVEYKLEDGATLVGEWVQSPAYSSTHGYKYQEGVYTFYVGPFWNYREVSDGDSPSNKYFLLFNIYCASSANNTTQGKKNPLKIYQVIDRLLETSEALRYGLDSPRYRLEYSAEQAPIMEQNAPEFHFANGRSLWENLRQIGQYIHAIPRITDGVLTFDELGGLEKASLRFGRRIRNATALNIEDYTAGLDSAVDNLINQDDLSDGSIVEPCENAYVSMRTVGDTARIQEETGVLLTAYPVEKIVSLKVASFTHDGKTYPEVDVTPYVFEKGEYDMLSSASGGYPLSKTYAIYYQQGQKNISGFWYRAQDKLTNIGNSLEQYAISNILLACYGLTGNPLEGLNYINVLRFNIVYVPSVSARLRQYKPNYKGNFHSIMAYNQSANRLSAVAYGENLRGQLAMMGNTTATVTYMFPDVEHVPEAGQLFDDKQYITSVTTRVFKDFVIAEMTLAEGYNELGAYVETNNQIRQFEIPSSRDRYIQLDEFCVISNKSQPEGLNMMADALKSDIIYELSKEAVDSPPSMVSLAVVNTINYDNHHIQPYNIALPAVTLAVGNSLYFGFRFEDNVNAGVTSEAPPSQGLRYRMAKGFPYGDKFYSEAWRLTFGFYGETYAVNAENANTLPSGYYTRGTRSVVNTEGGSVIIHKDSAEAICVTYQMHFLTDSDFIIGDGLAYWCRAVRKVPSRSPAVMYFFNRRINQLTGTTDTSDSISATFVMANVEERRIYPEMKTVKPFQSWAIIKDGKFVLGQNSSTVPDNIYFNFKRRLD